MDYNLHDTTVLGGDIFSPEERDIWVLYMKVMTSAGLGDVSEWMKLDMSMPQMKVLMLLNNHGTLKVSEIAEKMGASLSNTTGLLDRLEKSGFVKRSHSEEDRRSVVVHLTENAKNIFRGLYQKGHMKLKRSLEILSPDEKQAVSKGLSVLSRALEQAKKE